MKFEYNPNGSIGADGRPAPAYGFVDPRSGCFVIDPYASTCGRFETDPCKEYGIEEIDARRLVDCNRRMGVRMPVST